MHFWNSLAVEVAGSLRRLGRVGVSVGSASRNPAKFSNLKADLYCEARMKAIEPDFVFEETKHWQQLTWIKYKVNSDKRKIEDKQALKKRTGKSPNVAEAYILTLWEPLALLSPDLL